MKRGDYPAKPQSSKKSKNNKKNKNTKQAIKGLANSKNQGNQVELKQNDILKATEIYQRNKKSGNVQDLIAKAFPGKTKKYIDALFSAVNKKK